MNQTFKIILVKVGFGCVLLALWQAVASARFMPAHLFPGPGDVLKSLMDIARDGTLWTSIRLSMGRMLVGYSISLLGGVAVGVLAARSWLFKETVGSLIMALQSIPSICWLPFALIWIGIDQRAVLAVVILGALFSIAIATESAIRNIPPIYQKVGRVLGARGFVFSRDILFFAALPELIGGLKIGWTFAWRSLMAAELLRADQMGVARIIETGRSYNEIAMMMAGMIVILAVGLTVDLVVFGTLERRIRRRWGLEK
ncbi:MAG: ABC transporter permease [Candidatus Sumerlaeaceae bacterium]|nr:ABC transporter permease [Candidatus Sumerlaeaceae bacterium]